jgi:hypothetical protein
MKIKVVGHANERMKERDMRITVGTIDEQKDS